MQGLILAAGAGSRLKSLGPSKPLIEVAGRPLIEWALAAPSRAGIEDFVIVLGHRAEEVDAVLAPLAERLGVQIRTVVNTRWQDANGLSVLAAQSLIESSFYLAMCDHIFEPNLVAGLLADAPDAGSTVLGVDFEVEATDVDIADATKVVVADGKITDIGKALDLYDGFDVGAFRADRGLFAALEERSDGGARSVSLSDGVGRLAARGRMLAHDIGHGRWFDVDDPAGHRRAETAVKAADWPMREAA